MDAGYSDRNIEGEIINEHMDIPAGARSSPDHGITI